MPTPPTRSAGFTLIELLVSLALFALISLAGVSLIESTVAIDQRTAGRSDRLAEIQRAMYLVSADLEQLSSGPTLADGQLSFMRGSANGTAPISYYLTGNVLHRVTAGGDRPLLAGITELTWRFYRNGGWHPLPADPAPVTAPTTPAPTPPPRPLAIELAFTIPPGQPGTPGAAIAGPLRRVLALPRALP